MRRLSGELLADNLNITDTKMQVCVMRELRVRYNLSSATILTGI